MRSVRELVGVSLAALSLLTVPMAILAMGGMLQGTGFADVDRHANRWLGGLVIAAGLSPLATLIVLLRAWGGKWVA